ncbi:MAG: AAA family ATPase [Bacteroidetes bacterium]|nr:AAA family ATPase [Bacteroidota bacterium]
MINPNERIIITNARENNLKDFSLEIPHHKLIAVTGVSGSGKSSLAIDIIANEGRRQYLESIPSFARQFSGKISKPDVGSITGLYPVITIGQRTSGGSTKSTVGTLSEIYDYLRLLFARFGKADSGIKLSRSLFSFNNPLGACPACSGLGLEEKISTGKLIADPSKTLREGALVPTLPNGYIMYSQVTIDVLNTVCQEHGFNVDIPWNQLTDEQQDIILNGSDRIKVLYGKHSLESRLKWTALKAKPREEGYYKGMLPIMEDILRRDRNRNILRFVESVTCSSCEGKRLNNSALSVIYRGKTIDSLTNFELTELLIFFEGFNSKDEAEIKITGQICKQLSHLCNLGVGHLQLSRGAGTLTRGEIQRIRLVNQLSAQLSNVLYVFDEPSIGLHPRDNKYMIALMRELVNNRNTVIIIEHDLETIRNADWVIEVGPQAGIKGGELLFNGPFRDFINPEKDIEFTATQRVLLKEDEPVQYKTSTENHLVQNCSVNNLKGFDVNFKIGALNVITGVSGAGKASLVSGCLLPTLKNVIRVDQSPIGRTPRSNPATYTGLADHIRDLFASLPLSKELGFGKGRFSFNNKGGRCEECEGGGKIQIGMHYMGNIDVTCDKCNGNRFNDETLKVEYRNHSISGVYDLSINQAAVLFEKEPKILKYLTTLMSLGLGYLKLGQSSTTLSGGEAQRIKLATSLVKKTPANTWFILEEPTTGLHYMDTKLLIKALRELADKGNTIVYIEHQEQLIKASDWIIDLGPGSGKKGGQLLFEGPWNDFINSKDSITSQSILEQGVINFNEPRQSNYLKITNATTNNLKNVSVEFPMNEITVLTGLSGSGKSSIAFDTLYAEAQSRFTENLSTYARSFIKQSNNAKADSFENLTPSIAINRKNLPTSPRSTVGTMMGINEKYRFMFSRVAIKSGVNLTASSFSFNHESGACKHCSGLGYKLTADPMKLVKDWSMSIDEGALDHNATIRYYGNPHSQFVAVLREAAKGNKFSLSKSFNDFSDDELEIIFNGTGDKRWETVWEFRTKTSTGSKVIAAPWKGFCNHIDEEYHRRLHNKNLEEITSMMHEVECERCNGARVSEEALKIKIEGKNIFELSLLSIRDTISWFEATLKSELHFGIVEFIYNSIKPPLESLIELGLGHLNLNRRSSTLSGGEGQRLRLAQQLSGGLTGMTYVLDEPTIGLHQKNIEQLLKIIRKLKEKGNTIVIVEHEKEVIKTADKIIEVGPGSGSEGGTIVAEGNYSEFIKNSKAITPIYLGDYNLPKAIPRNTIDKSFGLRGVSKHNLVNSDFDFIAGGIIALTGISGSGKSTLVHHVLAPTLSNNHPVNCTGFYNNVKFDQIISVDHKSLSGTRSSTLSSYMGLLDILQSIFASCKSAVEAGIKKSAFSYNSKDGKCPLCNGIGEIKISMDFMDDVWNTCDECNGSRYNNNVSKIKLHSYTIGEVLNLTVSETIEFAGQLDKKLTKPLLLILNQLNEIGVGHLRLGQSISSLSGGESQRLKLSKSLLEAISQKNLFLLDEPTSGLHYKDIDALINVFNRLADMGHTILFIEHNPYLISIANQIIEL